jgi:hypothetical protein
MNRHFETPQVPASTAGHSRSWFFLHIETLRRVFRARACPRMPKLVYPSRTRAVVYLLNG